MKTIQRFSREGADAPTLRVEEVDTLKSVHQCCHRRFSTGEVSLSIRSHVAFVLNDRKTNEEVRGLSCGASDLEFDAEEESGKTPALAPRRGGRMLAPT